LADNVLADPVAAPLAAAPTRPAAVPQTALGILGAISLCHCLNDLMQSVVPAVYPILIGADGALMSESLFGLLMALALLTAYRLWESPGPLRAVLFGAVVGLAALTRGEAVLPHRVDGATWVDIGRPADLERAHAIARWMDQSALV
jgi:hypothetical protein